MMISLVVAYVLLLLLAVVIAALIRQVGVLNERIAPLGALTLPIALGPGAVAPQVQARTVSDETIVLGGRRATPRHQLLLFISPTCPMCKQLLRSVGPFAREEAERLEVVLIGDETVAPYAELIDTHGVGHLPLIVDATVGQRYQVGKLPYAVLVDANGQIRSAGLVNTREHLESLIVAVETGVASLQDYLRITRTPAPFGEAKAALASRPAASLAGDVG